MFSRRLPAHKPALCNGKAIVYYRNNESIKSAASKLAKILVVEDNIELAENIVDWLTNEQHNVDSCTDGVGALGYIKTYEYDAIVLDWALPKMNGYEILKQIRSQGNFTPVLMLTGRRDIDDKEQALDAGADDYLTKPFEMRELAARLRVMIRRAAGAPTETLRIADLMLDKQAKRVTKGGNEIKLMRKDFEILELLMSYPSKVFSAEALIERIWTTDSTATADVVRKHINRIRSQIDTKGEPSLIRTVHGIGYAIDKRA